MEIYVTDRNRIGSHAYAQCPIKKQREVEALMVQIVRSDKINEKEKATEGRHGHQRARGERIIFASGSVGEYRSRRRSRSVNSVDRLGISRSPPRYNKGSDGHSIDLKASRRVL